MPDRLVEAEFCVIFAAQQMRLIYLSVVLKSIQLSSDKVVYTLVYLMLLSQGGIH